MWAYHRDLEKTDAERYTFFGKKPKKTSRFWNPAILKNGKYLPTTPDDYGPDIYCDFILDFIERNQNDDFFAYYPMTLTHNPFVATPHSKDQSAKAKTKSQSRFFGDMIQYTGHLVDRILNKLEKLGIAENTLVMFTADNGTYRGIVSMMDDRVVHGGKGLPVDAGVHVPMLAYWKGTIAPGELCTDLIEFSDFFPTIANVGSANMPTDRVIDGRSFLAQLKGKKGNPRDSVTVHYDKSPDKKDPDFHRVRFAYDGRFKLYLDGRMFDVPNDWTEEHPLSTETASATVKDRRSKLQEALDTLPEWTPDNSYFAGKSSPSMQMFLDKHARSHRAKKRKRSVQ